MFRLGVALLLVSVYQFELFFYIGSILNGLWPEQFNIDSMSFFQLLSNFRFNSLWPSNVTWWQRYLGQHWVR